MSNRTRLRAKRAKIARMRKACGRQVENASPRTVTESKVIDDAWRNMCEQVIPVETHPELIEAYRRFYYAGAKAVIDTFLYTDCFDEKTDDLTESDFSRFAGMTSEVYDFFNKLAARTQ